MNTKNKGCYIAPSTEKFILEAENVMITNSNGLPSVKKGDEINSDEWEDM